MPTAAIDILFAVGGVRDVEQAIGSIGKGLDKLSRTGQAAAERSVRARVKGEQDAAKATEKGAQATTKAIEREMRARERAELNFIRAGQKAISAAETERTRAAEKGARERESIAKREAAAQVREIQRTVRENEQRARSFGRTAGGIVGRVTGGAGRLATAALGLGGGFAIADALGAGMRMEASAGQIVRSASNTGGLNKKDVQSAVKASALATSTSEEDTLAGLNAFVAKSGDLGAGVQMLEELSRVAATTGAKLEDLGLTAGDAFNKLGDVNKVKDVVRAFAGQGKAGALDIRDLGQYAPLLTASAGKFQGDLAGNIKMMGGLAQLAMKTGSAPTAAEATMGVSHIGTDISDNAKHFAAKGINIWADKKHTQLLPADQIMAASMLKTGGSLDQMKELFGERSQKIVEGARKTFVGAGGGKAGAAAIMSQVKELTGGSLSDSDIDAGVKDRNSETDAQVARAMTELRHAFDDLLPLLPELVRDFGRLIPYIKDFVAFLAKNPWEGLAAIVGAALAAEIAKAGAIAATTKIGTSVAAAVLGGAPAAGGGAAATGALGGSIASGGILAGGGLLGGLGVGLYGLFKGQEYLGKRKAEGVLGEAAGPEKAARLQEMISRAEATTALRATTNTSDTAVTDKLSPKEAKTLADNEAAGFAKKLAEMKQALAEATAGLQDFASKTTGGLDNPNAAGRGGVQ